MHQREHSEVDEREGLIHGYLDKLMPIPAHWSEMSIYDRINFYKGGELTEIGTVIRQRVCVAEIWCEFLGLPPKDMTKYNTKDLHNIMRNLEGWELHKSIKLNFGDYKLQRAYVRKKEENCGNISNQKRINNVANVATSCHEIKGFGNALSN